MAHFCNEDSYTFNDDNSYAIDLEHFTYVSGYRFGNPYRSAVRQPQPPFLGGSSKPHFESNLTFMMIDACFCRVSRIHEYLGEFPAILCRFLTQSEHQNLETVKSYVLDPDSF